MFFEIVVLGMWGAAFEFCGHDFATCARSFLPTPRSNTHSTVNYALAPRSFPFTAFSRVWEFL
jgi:hypothetical protein